MNQDSLKSLSCAITNLGAVVHPSILPSDQPEPIRLLTGRYLTFAGAKRYAVPRTIRVASQRLDAGGFLRLVVASPLPVALVGPSAEGKTTFLRKLIAEHTDHVFVRVDDAGALEAIAGHVNAWRAAQADPQPSVVLYRELRFDEPLPDLLSSEITLPYLVIGNDLASIGDPNVACLEPLDAEAASALVDNLRRAASEVSEAHQYAPNLELFLRSDPDSQLKTLCVEGDSRERRPLLAGLLTALYGLHFLRRLNDIWESLDSDDRVRYVHVCLATAARGGLTRFEAKQIAKFTPERDVDRTTVPWIFDEVTDSYCAPHPTIARAQLERLVASKHKIIPLASLLKAWIDPRFIVATRELCALLVHWKHVGNPLAPGSGHADAARSMRQAVRHFLEADGVPLLRAVRLAPLAQRELEHLRWRALCSELQTTPPSQALRKLQQAFVDELSSNGPYQRHKEFYSSELQMAHDSEAYLERLLDLQSKDTATAEARALGADFDFAVFDLLVLQKGLSPRLDTRSHRKYTAAVRAAERFRAKSRGTSGPALKVRIEYSELLHRLLNWAKNDEDPQVRRIAESILNLAWEESLGQGRPNPATGIYRALTLKPQERLPALKYITTQAPLHGDTYFELARLGSELPSSADEAARLVMDSENLLESMNPVSRIYYLAARLRTAPPADREARLRLFGKSLEGLRDESKDQIDRVTSQLSAEISEVRDRGPLDFDPSELLTSSS